MATGNSTVLYDHFIHSRLIIGVDEPGLLVDPVRYTYNDRNGNSDECCDGCRDRGNSSDWSGATEVIGDLVDDVVFANRNSLVDKQCWKFHGYTRHMIKVQVVKIMVIRWASTNGETGSVVTLIFRMRDIWCCAMVIVRCQWLIGLVGGATSSVLRHSQRHEVFALGQSALDSMA